MIYKEEFTNIKKELNRGFTLKYSVDRLVYFETFQNIEEAITREKNMKKWKCDWNLNLIEKANIKWLDLATDWYDEILE